MSEQSAEPKPAPQGSLGKFLSGGRAFWLLLFGVTWAASTWSFPLYKALDARWIVRFPKGYQIPVDDWLSDFTNWLVEDLSFVWFTFRSSYICTT